MAYATEPVTIDGIAFDALIDAEENWQSDVPAYPVETGFEVSDTIIIRPLALTMNLFLTNTPVTWRDRHEHGPYRVQDVTEKLKKLYFQKTPVKVKTTDRDYEDMAIVSIGLPKGVDVGTSRRIPISLQQIQVTETQTASIPASLGRSGATGVNAGVANTTSRPAVAASSSAPTSSNAQNQGDGNRGSVLYNLASGSGLFNSNAVLSGIFG